VEGSPVTIAKAPSTGPVAAIAGFVAWTLVGVGIAVGFVSLGVITLVPSLILGAVLASSRTARRSAFGLLVGLGLLLVFVAYVQRQGPGTTCWRTATVSGCDQHLDPRPWLVAGLMLITIGLLGSLRRGLIHSSTRSARL
jgi:hypothetical protein